jgi:hypothetical protein
MIDRPPIAQTKMYNTGVYIQFVCPFCNALHLAIEGKHPIRALVAILLFSRDPTAVRLAVTLAVVFSVNAVALGRSRPHVFQESLKAVPSLADCDSATAVARKGRAIGIGAPLNHSCPNAVFRGFTLAMRGEPLARQLNLKAAARSRLAVLEDYCTDFLLCSALTSTPPESLSVPRLAVKTQHRKSSEHLPGQVVDKRLSDSRFIPLDGCDSNSASARARVAAQESPSLDGLVSATFALTEPCCPSVRVGGMVTNHSEPTKHLSCQIFKIVGALATVGCSHKMFLSREGRLGLEPRGVTAPLRLANFSKIAKA